MTTTYFRYRPIDQSVVQIRVLTLRPGSYDDPISCELTHYRLDQANDFEALSYCWGDPTPSHQVFIGTGSLMVTKSAHSALRHLRLKDRYRRIWIDAICINQADRDERSHQVKYMGQIFKGASRVLAWLGPASPGSAKAIDLVRAVSARSPMKPAIEVWHAVQAFRDLMERPFWSRTWILQEIICPERAPLIGCGTQWDDWGTWASANPVDMGVELEEVLNPKSSILGRQTMETYTRAFEIFSGINYLRDLASELHHHHNGQGITNLNEVLTMSINSNCSDIRDHVFAIVGMIHLDGIPATIQPPKPDYNKTVRQVYSEITKFAIESDQTLLILYLRTHRKT
ncbi:putative HET domain protein, partial [Triangularia setosa]